MAAADPAVRRALFRRALRAGASAGAAGRPVTVCPYPPGTQRDLFVRGYVAAAAARSTR